MARELDAERVLRTIGLLKYDGDMLAEALTQAQARIAELEAELAALKAAKGTGDAAKVQ